MSVDFRLNVGEVVAIWALGVTLAGAQVRVVDADEVERRLDEPGRVTAVIYTNSALQRWTREAGAALDEFQGRRDFRLVVVADLRGTMADWAPGYTVRRMRRDLDAEARRVTPFYLKNGNRSDPRPDMSAVADFDGEASVRLGWEKPANLRRVLIFGKDRRVVYRAEDQGDLRAWRDAVAEALAR